MRPWFKKSCDWHRSAPVDELRSLLAQQTPLALVILDSVLAWCAENNVTTAPAPSVDREVRTWTTNQALGRRLVGALVDVGLLVREGDGYRIEAALVRPGQEEGEEAPPSSRRQRQRPETGKAARMRRYRAGKKASTGAPEEASTVDAPPSTQASTEASTGRLREASTEASTQETGGVYGASTEASTVDTPAPALSPPDPPPAPAPTPAQAQAQAQARERGAPVAAPAPSVGQGGVPPQAHPAPARPKAPAKPKAPRALPPRASLAQAYASGISRATRAPCSPATERWELEALESMATAHAAGRLGAELLGWLSQTAQDFVEAKATDAFLAGKGFAPKLALGWLNGGAEGRPAPAAPAAPPVPRISPHPGRPPLAASADTSVDASAAPAPGTSMPAAQALASALAISSLDGEFEAPPSRRPSLPAPLSPAEQAELIAKGRAQRTACLSLDPSLPQPQEPTA